MIKLIVALGNPGKKYESTRHNVGQMVVSDYLSAKGVCWKEKFKGLWTTLEINSEKRYFLFPQTYMNLSGQSVAPCLQFFKILPEEMLVIHDEIDLPFGTTMLKKGGGLAGHNGLKSIHQEIGTKDFNRLRLGISRPQFSDVSNWVLSEFSSDEQISLEKYFEGASKVLNACLENGIDKTQRLYGKKNWIDIK